MTEIVLSVPDISCGHCKSSIEAVVEPMDGVDSANVEINAKTVTVAFDPEVVELSAITTAIDDIGYEVDPVLA